MLFSVIQPASGQERHAGHEWSAGAYAEHQWLWRFFPAPPGTPRDFLFRRWDREHLPRFYVVSQRAPQATNSAWHIQSREYAPKLFSGMRLHFSLRVNPVVRSTQGDKGSTHDVVMHAKRKLLGERGLARWKEWTDVDRPELYTLVRQECGTWLRTRGARGGFELDEETFSAESYQQQRLKDGDVKFSRVDLSGELTVMNPEAFVSLLFRGIGKARAFGCGLMLVRAAR